MKRELRWIALVLVVAVVAIGSYYAYWLTRSMRSEHIVRESRQEGVETGLSAPLTLSSEFDPTQERAVFQVLQYDHATKRAQLGYEIPKERAGEQVSAVIACPDWGNTILEIGAKIPRLVSSATLLQAMSETPVRQLILEGKCSEGNCEKIVGACQLVIKAERREDVE